jgi:hypothetical protein
MSKEILVSDESGNFDFRPATPTDPSRFFAVGTVMVSKESEMIAMRDELASLRYDFAASGHAVAAGLHIAGGLRPTSSGRRLPFMGGDA